MDEIEKRLVFNDSNCVLCGHCIAVCPENAILYEDMQGKVLDFKEKLADDYVKQEDVLKKLLEQRQNPEWIKNRAHGKKFRKEETDTIKDFIEYAKAQGSSNYEWYYNAFSRCVNTELFIFNGISTPMIG